MHPHLRILGIALLSTAVIGCSKKVKETPPPLTPPASTTDNSATTQPMPPSGPSVPGAYTEADLDRDACLRQRTIYFDLDQDGVKPEFQAMVACHAKYLRDRPAARLTVQGHTDERGSREYNMGLGERRAGSVVSLLQANGGSAGQMEPVSYGEERPVCGEAGESCWSRNRRAEFIYTQR